MGLQLLQGFAGAATPREGRWLLRHEGSSWEMDVICFGSVGMWRIHQRKTVPKDMEYYGLACFWGVLRNDENDKASFLLGVLICIHILRVVVVSFPSDQVLRDRYDAWCLPSFLLISPVSVLHREVKGQSTHSLLQCLFCQSWSQFTPIEVLKFAGVMYGASQRNPFWARIHGQGAWKV